MAKYRETPQRRVERIACGQLEKGMKKIIGDDPHHWIEGDIRPPHTDELRAFLELSVQEARIWCGVLLDEGLPDRHTDSRADKN